MAIEPKCVRCGRELKKFGAILLAHPDKNGEFKKYHLCIPCYGVTPPKAGLKPLRNGELGGIQGILLSPPNQSGRVGVFPLRQGDCEKIWRAIKPA